MTGGTALARGDVVLVHFPFTDLSAQRLRPALIVGKVLGDDIILAFITSQVGTGSPKANCAINSADPEFVATGLKVSSAVRLDRIATLRRNLIPRRLGHIGPSTEAGISRALKYVFEL